MIHHCMKENHQLQAHEPCCLYVPAAPWLCLRMELGWTELLGGRRSLWHAGERGGLGLSQLAWEPRNGPARPSPTRAALPTQLQLPKSATSSTLYQMPLLAQSELHKMLRGII